MWQVDRDAWTELPSLPQEVSSAGSGGRLTAGPNGSLWLALDFFNPCTAVGGLYHFDGQAWSAVAEVPAGESIDVGEPVIGADGTLWVYVTDERKSRIAKGQGRILARLADGQWTTFDADDDVPVLIWPGWYGSSPAVDRDGTLWLAFLGDTAGAFGVNAGQGVFKDPETVGPCPGVLSFDGAIWRRYLAGMCAKDLAVAPDGRVWVTTNDTARRAADPAYETPVRTDYPEDGLFVIDPELVAAAE